MKNGFFEFITSRRRKISSFNSVKLRLTGMRKITEYEIVMKDGEAEVTLYGIMLSKGEDARVPEKRATCAEERFLKLLNDCRMLSWNGFHGKHPPGVKDGTMFSLDAYVNGGVRISANGSQNFPRRFIIFTDGLYNILCKEKDE